MARTADVLDAYAKAKTLADAHAGIARAMVHIATAERHLAKVQEFDKEIGRARELVALPKVREAMRTAAKAQVLVARGVRRHSAESRIRFQGRSRAPRRGPHRQVGSRRSRSSAPTRAGPSGDPDLDDEPEPSLTRGAA